MNAGVKPPVQNAPWEEILDPTYPGGIDQLLTMVNAGVKPPVQNAPWEESAIPNVGDPDLLQMLQALALGNKGDLALQPFSPYDFPKQEDPALSPFASYDFPVDAYNLREDPPIQPVPEYDFPTYFDAPAVEEPPIDFSDINVGDWGGGAFSGQEPQAELDSLMALGRDITPEQGNRMMDLIQLLNPTPRMGFGG